MTKEEMIEICERNAIQFEAELKAKKAAHIEQWQSRLRLLKFHDRIHYSENEKRLWKAIETDSRIKVINLNVRCITKEDAALGLWGRVSRAYPMLLFKFQCPCGDTRVESIRLPLNWKSEVPRWEKFLAEHLHKHLLDEGLLS